MIDPKYKNGHFWAEMSNEKALEDLFKNAIRSIRELQYISWDSLAAYSGISYHRWSAARRCDNWDDSEEHQLLLGVLKRALFFPPPQTPLESYL